METGLKISGDCRLRNDGKRVLCFKNCIAVVFFRFVNIIQSFLSVLSNRLFYRSALVPFA